MSGGRTFTAVGPLAPDEPLAEPAQMLGRDSDANRRSAVDVFRGAGAAKMG